MSGQNLNGIRVQMARMLEIYSLLRAQLTTNQMGLSAAERQRLQSGVDTIATNMRDLLALLTLQKEDPSAAGKHTTAYEGLGELDGHETEELEEILDAVLKWHAELSTEE
ncbi:MAG: hypothetical protein HN712_14275 [Gemmatimonadetes bacterium]|jgi:hypothetical protein|nr:hypothetical protein [Gemmatimonadota bacterium]MBT6147347.1 hypothetical protein [Gemmatimonadota bacterium]MBT7861485.1 hypothetical protein [Gemmatimonadota bacterium]